MTYSKSGNINGCTKVSGIFALVAGVTGLGLVMQSAYPVVADRQGNRDALKADIAKLWAAETQILSSVESCVESGYSHTECRDAWQAAINQSKQPGVRVGYREQAQCRLEHSQCNRARDKGDELYYAPPIVGIQTPHDTLSPAVVLYAGPGEGTGVRWDGQVFALSGKAPRP